MRTANRTVMAATRLFFEALEIIGAVWVGRYSGSRVSWTLRAFPAHRPSFSATLKIVRFVIAYVAILTIVWTLEVSDLSFIHQIAVIVFAALVAGGVLDSRGPVVKAVCSQCGKPMTALAETQAKIAFGCQTCGTTLSVAK